MKGMQITRVWTKVVSVGFSPLVATPCSISDAMVKHFNNVSGSSLQMKRKLQLYNIHCWAAVHLYKLKLQSSLLLEITVRQVNNFVNNFVLHLLSFWIGSAVLKIISCLATVKLYSHTSFLLRHNPMSFRSYLNRFHPTLPYKISVFTTLLLYMQPQT